MRTPLLCLSTLVAASGAPALPHPVVAQVQAILPVAPVTLYPEMFRLAQREEWVPLEKAVEVLTPWLEEVDRRTERASGENVELAVEAREGPRTVRALTVFVVTSVEVLLTDAQQVSSPPERRALIREAFAEALVLSADQKRRHFRLWSEVERQFRVAHQLSGSSDGSFGHTCRVLVVLLQSAAATDEEPE